MKAGLALLAITLVLASGVVAWAERWDQKERERLLYCAHQNGILLRDRRFGYVCATKYEVLP